MILVDIYVPAVNRQYDFKLDENAYIADILEEVGEMMLATEENGKAGIADLLFCNYESRQVLPLNLSMKQCGIGNGAKLVLL